MLQHSSFINTTTKSRARIVIPALAAAIACVLWQAVAVPAELRSKPGELDAEAIARAAGTKATVTPDGVVRIGWAREDVAVRVDGMPLEPFAGLGSWAAFKDAGDGAMVMGDTVVFQDEVDAAIDAALENGLDVTALHNHFFYDEPKVYFMHIGGRGKAEKLAAGVKAVWDAIKKVRAEHATPAESFPGRTPARSGKIDAKALEAIMGVGSQSRGGVVKFSLGRRGRMHGVEVGGSMGLSTWAAFSGSDELAVVDGDFIMTAVEVQTVLRALRQHGIHVVALHNHMIGEQPAFYFTHYWGKGRAEDLARAIKKTLDAQKQAGKTVPTPEEALDMDDPPPTREFSIRDDRPYLGGKRIEIWGLRCGNALYSQGVTERHVRNLDNMVAHGINCIGVYIQGSNGGYPDPERGRNGYNPDGSLKPDFARRLEWLVREADRRGMVVMVGLFSPRKDQELRDEAAIRRACEETAKFLVRRKLRNVFCDIMHEYNHARIDHDIFREPNGAEKKARLTRWFNKYAPHIEVGVCPTFRSNTADEYPGMQVRIIQKDHPIPKTGFVVNVETQRHDAYSNDGKFEPDEFVIFHDLFRRYQAAPNACMLFHSGWCQGITNGSGTGPNPEMGGYGKSEEDRGIRFYYEWVRDNIGRYEYPRHIKPTR